MPNFSSKVKPIHLLAARDLLFRAGQDPSKYKVEEHAIALGLSIGLIAIVWPKTRDPIRFLASDPDWLPS